VVVDEADEDMKVSELFLQFVIVDAAVSVI
jgi:hypothetical protein